MNEIELYDTVLLKNGSKAQIVDLLNRKAFIADVETGEDYETITIYPSDIQEILTQNI